MLPVHGTKSKIHGMAFTSSSAKINARCVLSLQSNAVDILDVQLKSIEDSESTGHGRQLHLRVLDSDSNNADDA